MDNHIFFGLLFLNWEKYVVSLLILLGIYSFIANKFVRTLLDPLLFTLIFTSFSSATTLFLFLLSSISTLDFINFCLAQLLFWTGFRLLYKEDLEFDDWRFEEKQEAVFLKTLFLISLAFNISSTLLTYYYAGVPIFAEGSRLETYRGGSGFGILSRIISFSSIVNIYCSFHFWSKTRKISFGRLSLILYMAFFLITSVLSGSKGAFLPIIFIFFCYKLSSTTHLDTARRSFAKIYKKLIYIGVSVAILVILLQSKDSMGLGEAVLRLGYRIISSGDVYWMAYPEQTYKIISDAKPFTTLFLDLLGSLRIVTWSDLPQHPGLTLNWHHHPWLSNFIQGPNVRFEVFGLALWGWGNLLFSFILGISVSWLMYRSSSVLPNGTSSRIVWTYCYMNAFALTADPIYGISMFNNLIFAFVLVILPAFLIAAALSSLANRIAEPHPNGSLLSASKT